VQLSIPRFSGMHRVSGQTARGRAAVSMIVFFLSIVVLFVSAPAPAQRRGMSSNDLAGIQGQASDTGFVFARVQFNSGRGGYRSFGGWAHDYPVAEHHILDLVNRLTRIHVDEESYVIVRLDSEEIFRYPFLYFSEVGEMNLTPQEAANFREYLSRGGIAMVDDFDSRRNLEWFQSQMRLVFPDRDFALLDLEHPIFHIAYDLESLSMEGPGAGGQTPAFYGYSDERERLSMIINHNNDIGDLWEWLDEPMYPLPDTLMGVRLGINYLLYSMTH